MSELLVQDLDPVAIEWLRARADRHGTSLPAEAKRVIEEAARASSEEDFWAQADRIRASLAGKVFEDSAELIRQDRER